MTELATRDYPDYRKGKRTKKKLRGGPFAGISMGFLDSDLALKIEKGGVYVGQYVRREVAQKNRTIAVYEWEPAVPEGREERVARLKALLRLGGPL